MTTCDPGDKCAPICDFCRHYDRKGHTYERQNGATYWVYEGPGWCRFHDRESDIIDSCDDFHCFRAKARPS